MLREAEAWQRRLEVDLRQQKGRAASRQLQIAFTPKMGKKSVTESPSGSLVQEAFQLALEKRVQQLSQSAKRMQRGGQEGLSRCGGMAVHWQPWMPTFLKIVFKHF